MVNVFVLWMMFFVGLVDALSTGNPLGVATCVLVPFATFLELVHNAPLIEDDR
jgi:hypothetical protein